MTHFDTIEAFADRASGRLSRDRQAQVDRHLAECPACRSAYDLLNRTLEPGAPTHRLAADPFLPTHIRAMAQRPSGRRAEPILRWSFASVAFSAAVALGILIGLGLPDRTAEASTSEDFVSELSSSLTPADLGDQWYSAIENEKGIKP